MRTIKSNSAEFASDAAAHLRQALFKLCGPFDDIHVECAQEPEKRFQRRIAKTSFQLAHVRTLNIGQYGKVFL